MNNYIKKLLKENNVSNELRELLKEGYRNVIEDVLDNVFDVKPSFKYGGSLAKHTANKNSADIDLLCYIPHTSQMTVEEIYDKTSTSLKDAGYYVTEKNSAIYVYGKDGKTFEYTIDVVPGKYIDNEDNDVNLWNNRENRKIKTNPIKQRDKIIASDYKKVIRFIKLIRDLKQIKFKSFYLELFIIDVIEEKYNNEDDTLQDQIMNVLYNIDLIGEKKVYDPANKNNDIMDIHTFGEYVYIKNVLSELRDVLLTNDIITFEKYLNNESYNIDKGYINNAKSHSIIKFDTEYSIHHQIIGDQLIRNNYSRFYDKTELEKNINLRFTYEDKPYKNVRKVEWIICNSGYEAYKASQLRGVDLEQGSIDETSYSYGNKKYHTKKENTLYIGNHFVQAKVTTSSNKVHYTNVLEVRVR